MNEIYGHKILIVDDEEIVVKSLRRQLQTLDQIKIETALNAKQAINIIKIAEQPFSLIISDLNMPGIC
jgi:YesN/AraC family two-component response regulator